MAQKVGRLELEIEDDSSDLCAAQTDAHKFGRSSIFDSNPVHTPRAFFLVTRMHSSKSRSRRAILAESGMLVHDVILDR